eukprot:scaffold1740_cov109-Isochrysis_galbana.AAC.4
MADLQPPTNESETPGTRNPIPNAERIRKTDYTRRRATSAEAETETRAPADRSLSTIRLSASPYLSLSI